MNSESSDQIPLRPEAITLTEYFRRWGVILSPFFLIAMMAWAFHLVWHRSDPFIFLFLWLPTGFAKAYFGYLRAFRTERAPAPLQEGCEEFTTLKLRRTRLNRAGYGLLGFCVLLGSTISLCTGWHAGKGCFFIPDALWPWMALPILASCVFILWSQVLEAHMKERMLPVGKVARSSRAPRSGRVMSGSAFRGNGFRSEHWGQPVSKAHVQLEYDSDLPCESESGVRHIEAGN